jgi:hypothetical protein
VATDPGAIRTPLVSPSGVGGCSPIEETRIVRKGNLFRVRGWFQYRVKFGKYDDGVIVHEDYLLQMQYDPELDVWHLVGHVEDIH